MVLNSAKVRIAWPKKSPRNKERKVNEASIEKAFPASRDEPVDVLMYMIITIEKYPA